MRTINKFANFLKAVGRKLSSATVETMTDQSFLPSLDNYHTKKYNNCDNFEWHKVHPLSGVRLRCRGLSPTATPNAIISEQYKNNQRFFDNKDKAVGRAKFVLAEDKTTTRTAFYQALTIIRQISIIINRILLVGIFVTSFLRFKFAVGVSPYGRPQTPLYQKSLKNSKINGLFQKIKNYFIAQKDGAKKLRSDYFFIMTLIFRRKRLNFRYNKNIGLLCRFTTNPFELILPKLFCSFGSLIIQVFSFKNQVFKNKIYNLAKDGAIYCSAPTYFRIFRIFNEILSLKNLKFARNTKCGLLCRFIATPFARFSQNLESAVLGFGDLIIQSFAFNTLKNVLKSLLLPFVVLGLSVNLAFADGNTNPNSSQNIQTTPESITQEMAKIFVNTNDAVIDTGTCEFKCRDVKANYVTQINGFDFVNGTTFCEIFKKEERDSPLKYNADQKNYACIKKWQEKIPEKAQYANNNLKSNIKSKISQTTSDKEITLSRFLSGIVTLDPKIINRDSTNTSGQIVLANGVTTRSGSVSGLYDYFDKNPNNNLFQKGYSYIKGIISIMGKQDVPLRTLQGEKTSTAEGFNKANLAFFSNLFENMNEVYQHLQWLLFVVVGSFFLISIGTAKFQRYLENNGEANSNQPYLHKFMIPLITIGFFFMPIPEGSSKNDQATMIQNIIRYFTAKATDIADIASAKGGATYMNKIYASVGGADEQTELMYQINLAQYNFIKTEASKNYQNKCSARFSEFSNLGVPFAEMSEQELKEYLEKNNLIDINKISGTSNDIKFEACIALEQTIWEANAEIKKAENNLLGIKNYYENNKLQNNLKNIDGYLSKRENELGWINSTITASSGFMVEMQSFITDNVIQQKDNIATNTQKNQQAIVQNQTRGSVTKSKASKDLSAMAKGYLMGNSAWFIIPGTYQIYQIIKDNASILTTSIGTFLGATNGKNALTTIIGGTIGWLIGTFGDTLIAFIAAPYLMENMLEKVPALAICVAGMIAVASYLVSLCKYFYLSPFVVAFSLTTKRLDKIVNFLVTGITIFFKPVLIVLFIYLALFLNVLINELFVFMSIEQFGALLVSDQDFFASLGIAGIKAILKIFAILGSSYVVWRLVISGPDWVMKLIGIDNSSDNIISQGLTQNLEKRSFMA